MEKILIIFGLLIIVGIKSSQQQNFYRPFAHHAEIQFSKSLWIIMHHDYFCSGVIIGDNWVLTLAKCYNEDFRITVYVGSDIFGDGIEKKGLEFVRNDTIPIGLIRTEKIEFSNIHRPLPLPNEAYPKSRFVGERCQFTEWENYKSYRRYLRLSQVTILDLNYCAWEGSIHLCGNFSSYNAASVTNPGNPLIFKSPDGPMVIALFDGTIGGIRNFLSLSDSSYIDWIENKTQLSVQIAKN